jgi:hypothetical protein
VGVIEKLAFVVHACVPHFLCLFDGVFYIILLCVVCLFVFVPLLLGLGR